MDRNITTVCGSPGNPNTWIYRTEETGVYVREAHIESVAPNREQTTLVQITDVHLNDTNAEDEADEEIMYTRSCRTWNADGISVKALRSAMEYAGKYDRTIITGDTLDYLSRGAMELMQKYIWDVDRNCIVTLGGHDVTKQMQTKRHNRLPLCQRQKILEEFWRHDMYYFSEILHDNVMVIQLDNGCHRYWESQVPRLAADIGKARAEKLTVLIFQHEPICTGRPEDARFPAFYVWEDCEPEANFYDACVGYALLSDAPTMEIYRMITENADIIRGIFCGHEHTSFYMEVEGSYRDKAGNIHRQTIPQYILECNVYEGYTGHVLKITVGEKQMLSIIPQPQIVREKSKLFCKEDIRESILSMPHDDGRVQHLLHKVWNNVDFRRLSNDEIYFSINGYTEEISEDTFRVLSEHNDSYYISIDKEGIYVFSLCAAGLFYGIQTLRQIIENNAEVPCCEIIDYPDIKMRCTYLDLRQSFPRFENLISYIEMMAEFKTNTLIIEYENTFPFEKYAHLKNSKFVFTEEQLTLILDTARQNFIEVIPLQQSFGHLEYVLKDRRHMHLRETAADLGELCPCNPDSLKLVCSLIDEVAAKHPRSRYIHLGCDEVWSLGSCRRCKEIYGENKGRMFVDFVNKLVSHVCALGKKPIIWHDMLEHCGESEIAELDNRVSVMIWLYGAVGLKKQISGLTALFRKYGIEVFGACAVRSNDGLDTQNYPKIDARIQNIDGWAAEAKRLGIPLVAAANWAAAFSMGTPYGIYETSIYPMYYCGERLWNHEGGRNTFLRRFLQIFHGIGYTDAEWDKGIPGYETQGPGNEDYYELLAQIADQARKHKDIADFIHILSRFHVLAREIHCANSYLYRYRMFQSGDGELISLRNRTKAKVERFMAFKPVLRDALERFLPEEMAEMYIAARYFVPETIYTEVYEKYGIL